MPVASGGASGGRGTSAGGGVVVVGVGHPDRADDAVGLLVAEAVRAESPDIDVVLLADPLALLDVVVGRDGAVVVDAAVAGSDVGTVCVVDAGESPLPENPAGPVASSHGLSVGAAIELARALGVLPARLVVVTIEIGSIAVGQQVLPAVLDAVEPAAEHVLRLCKEVAGRTSPRR